MGIFRTKDAKHFPNWKINVIGELLIRKEDQEELKASSGLSPGETLREAVASEGRAFMTWDKNQGKLIAVFGIHESRITKGGIIWMVGTPALANCVKEFYKVSKRILEHWLNKYGILHNFVDSRNEAHIKWLKRLDFSFPGQEAELNKVPFKYFYKEKS